MITIFLFFVLSLLLTAVSDKKNLSKVFCLIVLGISTISFFYVPTDSADLYRHYENIEFYGEMGLNWVIENRLSLNPLTHLSFYVFSLLEEPRLYPTFCTLITYGFSFLLLYRASKFYSLNRSVIVLLTVFLLFNWNYLLVVSNCRIFMLYALVAYFFYLEFIENRLHKSALIVYISSVLFHYGILLVVIPRFILYFYKPANKMIYVWAILIIMFFAYFGTSTYQTIFWDSLSDKIEGYKHYETFGKWQFLNSLILVLLCCFYVFRKRVYLINIKRLYILFWLIILPIFFQISNFQVIYRESNLVVSLAIVFFSHILSKNNDHLMRNVIGLQSIFTITYSFLYVYPYMDFSFVI